MNTTISHEANDRKYLDETLKKIDCEIDHIFWFSFVTLTWAEKGTRNLLFKKQQIIGQIISRIGIGIERS